MSNALAHAISNYNIEFSSVCIQIRIQKDHNQNFELELKIGERNQN